GGCSHPLADSTVVCRAAAGVCDLAERCTGSDPLCPSDQKSTGVCRATAGSCDVAEQCNGAGNDCPADVVRPSDIECRSSTDLACDPAEFCTGSSGSCPPDAISCSGACGNGVTDEGEDCDEGLANGAATSCCTEDCRLRASGETCRASGGVCDPAETCTGVGPLCPDDAKTTVVCR